MRRLTSALVVVLTVFAVSAFAASFEVNDTVLASGTGDVLTCTDAVEITYHNSGNTPPPPFGPVEYDSDKGDWMVDNVRVVTNGEGCGSKQHTLVLLDAGGQTLFEGTGQLGNNGNFLWRESNLPGGGPLGIPVGDLAEVRVLIQD